MRILQSGRTLPVAGVGFGPGGRTVVAGGTGGFAVHDLVDGGCSSVVGPRSASVLAFVPDPLGRCLYLSLNGRGCLVRDLKGPSFRDFPTDDQRHVVVSLAASADGVRVAVSRRRIGPWALECWAVGEDGRLSSSWCAAPARAPQPDCLLGLAFHPQGGLLAACEVTHDAAGMRYALRLRDASTGALLGLPGQTTRYVGTVRSAFTPDGSRVLVWDVDGVVLFGVGDGSARLIPYPGRAYLRGAAVHPSGRFFATVANDGIARYWDLSSLEQTQAFAWKAGKLGCVAFSPDGMLAAAGTDGGQVVLWDVDA
jgi:WD40 repeat protein